MPVMASRSEITIPRRQIAKHSACDFFGKTRFVDNFLIEIEPALMHGLQRCHHDGRLARACRGCFLIGAAFENVTSAEILYAEARNEGLRVANCVQPLGR